MAWDQSPIFPLLTLMLEVLFLEQNRCCYQLLSLTLAGAIVQLISFERGPVM